MNLEPNIWGPHYWATLHYLSSTYDNNPNESIKSTMKNFIQSLPVFLPCKECQDHAFEFIKTTNLNSVVTNRKELFTFFFNFHNTVNQRLKKPLMKLEDALKMYHIPEEEYILYSSSSPTKYNQTPSFITPIGIISIISLILSIIVIITILKRIEFR